MDSLTSWFSEHQEHRTSPFAVGVGEGHITTSSQPMGMIREAHAHATTAAATSPSPIAVAATTTTSSHRGLSTSSPRLCSPSPLRPMELHCRKRTAVPLLSPPQQQQREEEEKVGEEEEVSASGADGDSDWASPAEVRRIRAACGALSRTFHQQRQRLNQVLQAVKAERDAYLAELTQIKKLKGAYQEGKRAFEAASEAKKAWTEERVMLQVQLQALAVENERLRLELRKRRKGLLLQRRPAEAAGVVQRRAPQTTATEMCSPSPAATEGKVRREGSHGGAAVTPGRDLQSTPGVNSYDDARRLDHTLPLAQEGFDEEQRHPGRGGAVAYAVENVADGAAGQLGRTRVDNTATLAALEAARRCLGSSESLPTPSSSIPSSTQPSNQQQFSLSNTSGAPQGEKNEAATTRQISEDRLSSTPTYAKNVSSLTVPTANTTDNTGVDFSTVNQGTHLSATDRTQSSPPVVPSNVMNPLGFNKDHTSAATTESLMSNVSSISLLYHIPRTPAEALKEELRLLQVVHQLAQQNTLLEERLKHATHTYEAGVHRMEQQVVLTTHENESLKRQLRVSQDSADEVRLEAHALTTRLEAARAAEAAAQEALREANQQHIDALRAVDASHARATDALKREHAKEVARLQREGENAAALADRSRVAILNERNACLAKAEKERADTLAAAQDSEKQLIDLQRSQRELQQALEEATHEMAVWKEQWCGESASLKEALERAQREASETSVREKELAETVRRQNELIQLREGALTTMEHRFTEACQQLAVARKAEEDLLPWRLRAEALDTELKEQKAHAEAQVSVLHTAMTTMQRKHDQGVALLVKRYERLSRRVDMGKCRVLAPQREMFSTSSHSLSPTHRASPTAKKPRNRADAGKPDRPDKKGEGGERDGACKSGNPSALSCDPREILRGSTAAIEALTGSIHRVS